jgi:hypothetical protein
VNIANNFQWRLELKQDWLGHKNFPGLPIAYGITTRLRKDQMTQVNLVHEQVDFIFLQINLMTNQLGLAGSACYINTRPQTCVAFPGLFPRTLSSRSMILSTVFSVSGSKGTDILSV